MPIKKFNYRNHAENIPLYEERGFTTFEEALNDNPTDPDKDDYDTYMTDNVGNLYNRMILFRWKDLPHRSNLPGFGDSLETGRLSQHFFFNEVKWLRNIVTRILLRQDMILLK